MHKTKLYGKYGSVSNTKYKFIEEIAVRNFVKGLLAFPPLFKLKPNAFLTRQSILDFLNAYDPRIKISLRSLSRYKNNDVKMIKLQKTVETESFVNYVIARFPEFDKDAFYQRDCK